MSVLINFICCLVPIASVRRKIRKYLKTKYIRYSNKKIAMNKRLLDKPLIIWFDHSLGGGTDIYSLQQFTEVCNEYVVLRIQYYAIYKSFKIYFPNNRKTKDYWIDNIHDLENLLNELPIKHIVINDLVGYNNSLDILDLITKIKHKNTTIKVSFKCHDFQAICPNFTLVNCEGQFCNLKYKYGCEKCWKKIRLGNNDIENNILRSGAIDVASWRMAFDKFFTNIVDEVVVFSEFTKNIFERMYPILKTKIIIVPHSVKKYSHITIPKHDSINIACLGNISYNKGAQIIREMCSYIKNSTKYNNVNMYVIGNIYDSIVEKPENLIITGEYKQENLPHIISKLKIDCIFIPSICPETFSYTTSEAMSMGLPVVCFNLGAPAERISKYEQGLVLQEINSVKALKEIIKFVQQLHKK